MAKCPETENVADVLTVARACLARLSPSTVSTFWAPTCRSRPTRSSTARIPGPGSENVPHFIRRATATA
eukprot:2747268-Rhodomonas_salina.3